MERIGFRAMRRHCAPLFYRRMLIVRSGLGFRNKNRFYALRTVASPKRACKKYNGRYSRSSRSVADATYADITRRLPPPSQHVL